MFNVALAISILVASVLPVGQSVLLAFVSPTILRGTLGAFGTSLVVLFFKYFLLALVIYSLFRLARVDRKFNFATRGIKVLFIANAIVILYAVVRALASLIEGGGGAFVVAQFGMFILCPAWIAILVGLFQLWRAQTPAPK